MTKQEESQSQDGSPKKRNDVPKVEDTGKVLELDASSTPEEERAVVRKIDMVVLPLMCFVFFLQYLDKQSLSYAAVRETARHNDGKQEAYMSRYLV